MEQYQTWAISVATLFAGGDHIRHSFLDGYLHFAETGSLLLRLPGKLMRHPMMFF